MTVQEKLIEHIKTLSDEEAEWWLQQMENRSQPPRRLSEIIQEAFAGLSQEEQNDLPTDLAEQHDHYAYGLPKR